MDGSTGRDGAGDAMRPAGRGAALAATLALLVAIAGGAAWWLTKGTDGADGPPAPHADAAVDEAPCPSGEDPAARERARPHVERALDLARRGDDAGARAEWDAATRADPGLVIEHLDGALDRAQPHWIAAVDEWLARAAACPGDEPLAAAARELARVRRGDPETTRRAADALELVVGRAPDRRRIRIARAHARWAAGRFDLALADAEVLVTRWPEEGALHLLRARWLGARRRVAEARAELEEARRVSADPGIDATTGWIELERLRLDEARAAFERAAQRAPERAEPLVGLGVLACRRAGSLDAVLTGNRDEALREAHERHAAALEREPERDGARLLGGMLRVLEGDAEAGVAVARAVLARAPHDDLAHELLLAGLAATGREPERQAAFEQWLIAGADPARAHLAHAMLLAPRDPAAATRDFARARLLAPRDPSAPLREAATLIPGAMARRREDARGLIEALIAARDLDAELTERFCGRFGMTSEAVIRLARTVAAGGPVQTPVPMDEALALAAQGRLADAEQALLAVLREPRPPPIAHFELVKLYLERDAARALGRDAADVAKAAIAHADAGVAMCNERAAWRELLPTALLVRARAQVETGALEAGLASREAALRARAAAEPGAAPSGLFADVLAIVDASIARARAGGGK